MLCSVDINNVLFNLFVFRSCFRTLAVIVSDFLLLQRVGRNPSRCNVYHMISESVWHVAACLRVCDINNICAVWID